MININCGILTNATPLSAERIKEIEALVLEENQTFAYLDTEGKLCFSMPYGVEGIKELAWHKAYELSKENNVLTKKVYIKTGLKTFTSQGYDIVTDNYTVTENEFGGITCDIGGN